MSKLDMTSLVAVVSFHLFFKSGIIGKYTVTIGTFLQTCTVTVIYLLIDF